MEEEALAKAEVSKSETIETKDVEKKDDIAKKEKPTVKNDVAAKEKTITSVDDIDVEREKQEAKLAADRAYEEAVREMSQEEEI